MEDGEIIALFWERNQAAISQTKSSYGVKLRRLAAQILKNSEDAEECENDTYFKAWECIPPQKPTFFYAYLAKICRFLAFGKLDWNNAAKRRAELVELTAEMELCIPDARVQTQMEGEEIGAVLNTFLAALREENRMIFMRRYWFADSIRDISERYHISESKVKTSLHRTRNHLKRYLESEGITV